MSLTDDWKAGELPSGDENHEWLSYYIKHEDGLIHSDSYWRGDWGMANRNSIEEILDKVPSYDELQDLKSQIKHLKDLQANEDKEVERLRDLLKECKEELREFDNNNYPIVQDLLTRINSVIGESEEK